MRVTRQINGFLSGEGFCRVLTEGVSLNPRTREFDVDVASDNRYTDLVFTGRSRVRGNVFAAFSINPRLADHDKKLLVKNSLKKLEKIGRFEELMDKAVENFCNQCDPQSYDIIITAHQPRDPAFLANNLVASLQPHLRSDVQVILGGVRKSPLENIRCVEDAEVKRLSPPGYSGDQLADLIKKVKYNIESAKKRATREDRAFKMTDVLAQFRKFVTGFVNADPLPDKKVLFVDDIYTTGSTVSAVADALQTDNVDAFVILVG